MVLWTENVTAAAKKIKWLAPSRINSPKPENRIVTRMKLSLKDSLLFAVLLATATALPSPAVLASGSVGTGGSGVSQYGQMYEQGKALFFKKIACSREDCPIRRDQVNATLAAGLVESLRTRDELKAEESENDAVISILCPGQNGKNCVEGGDEQAMVQHYLTRRFDIKD